MPTNLRSWTDAEGTLHLTLRLEAGLLRTMHPDRLECIRQATALLQEALTHPERPTVAGEIRRELLKALEGE